MALNNGTGTEDPTQGMQRGAEKPTPPPIRQPKVEGAPSLQDLRGTLTPDQRKVVKAVMGHLERDFIESLPELTAGIKTSARQGSWSATLQIKEAKKRLRATLAPRVRTPHEVMEIDMHLDDDGQIALGFGPEPEYDDDDPEGEE